MRDRADGRGAGAAEFGDHLFHAVLADDGCVTLTAALADGGYGTEGAGVVGGGKEDVFVAGVAVQELEDDLVAFVAHAAAVHADEALDRDGGQAGFDAFKGSGGAALNGLAGFFQVQADDPVDLALPAG